MKKVLIGMLVAMGASSAAVAQGNPEAGKELTTVCAACHGADGNSALANFPKLAGQQQGYLLKQLKDIKSGTRAVTEMTGLLNGFSNENLADIAAYYASNSVVTGQADPELVEAGKALYRSGNANTGVPACMACHGPAGKGIDSAAYPSLAGQHAGYTAAQLKKFQTNERTNDPAKIMQDIAFKMNDREIKAVSSYIQGLY